MTDALTIEEIKDLNVYQLASIADCAQPDHSESPGALMLSGVRDAVLEAIDSGSITLTDQDDNGQLDEIADGAPSAYTYECWQQFTDLGAWQEEPESGEWPEDLTKTAMIALYQIADRLAHALVDSWVEGWTCPLCGDTGTPHICLPGECNGSEEEQEAYAASQATAEPADPHADHVHEYDSRGTFCQTEGMWLDGPQATAEPVEVPTPTQGTPDTGEAVSGDAGHLSDPLYRLVADKPTDTQSFIGRMDAINAEEFAGVNREFVWWRQPSTWVGLALVLTALVVAWAVR
jgi:hypothetical protein